MDQIIKLKDIMSVDLASVEIDAFLDEVVKLMQERRVSSVIITQEDKPLGIITQRDILKAFNDTHKTLKMGVSDFMSSPVHTLNIDTDYRDAYIKMCEHDIRHIVITNENGLLVGILSESDFLNYLTPKQLLTTKEVKRVMNKEVISCKSNEALHSALDKMLQHNIGAIVVEENDKAIGIVSESDTLKLIGDTHINLDEPISSYMSSPVMVIHYEQTILNAQTLMDELKLRRLIVVDDDEKIIGVISCHDLIKYTPEHYVEMLRDMIHREKSLVSKIEVELDKKIVFQNALKSLPHALIILTRDNGEIEFVNTQQLALCKIPELKLSSKLEDLKSSLFDLFQKQDWKNQVHSGKTVRKVVKLQHENSVFCYFDTSISAVFDDNNHFEGYLYIARDISQEQTIDLEVKRLNSHLKEVCKITHIGNWELDAKTLEAYCSDEICDIIGLPRGTKCDMKLLKTLLGEADYKRFIDSVSHSLNTGDIYEGIYKIYPKNSKQELWVECRAKCELNPDKSIKSLIGTIQDVTRRVKTEHNVEHLNSLLKSIRNVNKLIVKAKSEQSLLQDICNEIVMVDNFYGIWIFMQTREKQFYSAGYEKDLESMLKQNIIEGKFLEYCTKLDNKEICRVPVSDCVACPLSDSHVNTDVLIVPIMHEESFYGYIGFSVGKNITQDDEEQELVQEMARDIAFSLYMIDQRNLHEKEQKRYRSLVEQSNDAIYMHTLEGVLIDVNPTLAKIHGCSKEELIGKNVKSFYQEEQLKIAESHFAAIQETGTVSFEMEFLRIDGTPFQAELVASLVEFEGETVVQGSLRDVSERYNAEQKAQENETNMIVALEGAGHGVWDWNLEKETLYLSPQYKEMLGYKDDEMENSLAAFLELIHPDDLSKMESNIKLFLEHKKKEYSKIKLIFRMRAKNGTYRWILSVGNIVSNSVDGTIKRIIGTNTDISEQKFEEEKFKRIFDDSPTGILYYNADGKIVSCNHIFARFFHSDAKKLEGLPMYETLQDQKLIEAMKDAIAEGNGYYEGWYNAVTTDSSGYGRAVFKGIRDADGIIRHAVGLVSDYTQQKQAEDELRIFKRSVESSTQGIVITTADENTETIYVNPAFEQLTGYTSDELLGKNLSFLNDTTIHQPELEKLYKAITNKESVKVNLKNQHKDGSSFISELFVDPILDEQNNVTHFVGIQKDITEIKKNERKLRQSATVFENTAEGVIITDINSIILDVNEAFSIITGYEHSEVIGRKTSLLKSGRHNHKFYADMWNSIHQTDSWHGEVWNRRKNGEVYPQWLNINCVKNTDGDIENYIAVFSDITQLKETQDKLDFLAYHDHLTELPNRTLLKARLDHTLSSAKRENCMTAVMFMDLDNFKNINDSYGHSFGDELLVAVSKRIETVMREDDTFARIGGDEFVIVMSHFMNSEQVRHSSKKIMNQFEKPFKVQDKELWVSMSMGLSIAPDDGTSAEILIKNADTAMYEAKDDGKNTLKFYNDKMSALSFERVVFENALKNAISNREFEVYYQPQENLQNNSIIGFEALVRWIHPSLGMVSPDRFIPIAEETKMILEIGEFVLEQACKDIKKWHEEGLCKGRIAVNVSGVQLEHSEFADILKSNLKHYDIDPSMIEIEVTESMVMKNPERWISILEEVKRTGISISIDDFGTGYSSLSYLRRLPVDTLKIDQSFIQDIPDEKDACAIVDAIINMAHSLGLNTLAEGVETQEQRKYLVQKSCQHAQGYLLSKPMNGEKTYNWLKERF